MALDGLGGRGAGTPGSGLALDLRSLDALKSRAAQDPKAAAREAARQLESLFMQELMKSMRASTLSSGLLDNSGSELGTEMLDTQLATGLAGQPGGLTAAILRQLERSSGAQASEELLPQGLRSLQPAALQSALQAAALAPAQAAGAPAAGTRGGSSVQATPAVTGGTPAERFVRQHLAAAQAAEKTTGLPAAHVIGQAALESGWGRREIKMADGSPSHNLFGIKAGKGWTGKVAEVTTTEYVNGVPRRVTARFRAYDSYEEAFIDHAKLLKSSPRYDQVIARGDTVQGYAQGLQRAGYATDPAYADKLTRVINTTLRLQRAVT